MHPTPRQHLPHGENTTITTTVDPQHHTHQVLALAARLPYLVSIAGPTPDEGRDPLATESADEILTLLGELADINHAIDELTRRAIRALDGSGHSVSDRRLARSMGVATTTAQRWRHTAQEGESLVQADAEYLVTVNGGRYSLPRDLAELRRDAPELVNNLTNAADFGATGSGQDSSDEG